MIKHITSMFVVVAMVIGSLPVVTAEATPTRSAEVGPFVFELCVSGWSLHFTNGNNALARPLSIEFGTHENPFKITTNGIKVSGISGGSLSLPGYTHEHLLYPNGDFVFKGQMDDSENYLPANDGHVILSISLSNVGTITLKGDIFLSADGQEQVINVDITLDNTPLENCNDCKMCIACDCIKCGYLPSGCICELNKIIEVGPFVFALNKTGTKLIFANGDTALPRPLSIAFYETEIGDFMKVTADGFDWFSVGPNFNLPDVHNTMLWFPNGELALFADMGDTNTDILPANEIIATFYLIGTGTVTFEGVIILEIEGQKQIFPMNATFDNKIKRGHVTGGDKITITDALEVLKHLAGITTLTGNSFEAALITPQSQTTRRISINDVLEILKHLAGISKINQI
jgi:hypothetical protein